MPGNARPRTTMMKRPSYGFGISRDRLLAGESVRTALSRQLYRARIESPYWPASCRCDGILAMCGRFGSEVPQCGSGDEVALKVEGVVNRTVHAQEALGGSSRLEPLQLALASSDCLMRKIGEPRRPAPEQIAVRYADTRSCRLRLYCSPQWGWMNCHGTSTVAPVALRRMAEATATRLQAMLLSGPEQR